MNTKKTNNVGTNQMILVLFENSEKNKRLIKFVKKKKKLKKEYTMNRKRDQKREAEICSYFLANIVGY